MFNATLIQRTEITADLLILRIKPDTAIPDFTPGQYVAIGLPGSSPRPADFPPEPEAHAPDKFIKRAYSIGSPPQEKEYLEFYIAIVPTGALTSRLVMLKEGDRMHMAPKVTGHFTLHAVPTDKNLIFIATGTGLAPFMSMIRTESTWEKARSVTILHGVRYERDLAYQKEIAELQAKYPNLHYYAFVSREESKKGVFQKGYVQQVFTNGILSTDPEMDHVFMCGNPAMIDDVEKILGAKGYIVNTKKHPGSLHVEKYW